MSAGLFSEKIFLTYCFLDLLPILFWHMHNLQLKTPSKYSIQGMNAIN